MDQDKGPAQTHTNRAKYIKMLSFVHSSPCPLPRDPSETLSVCERDRTIANLKRLGSVFIVNKYSPSAHRRVVTVVANLQHHFPSAGGQHNYKYNLGLPQCADSSASPLGGESSGQEF